MKHFLRRIRRDVNGMLGRDIRIRVDHRCRRVVLGSEYGQWCICPDGVTSETVVYSFGVGADISWDVAMIEQFDVEVHAFDPTPAAVEWIRNQRIPEKFHFHELGLADFDGEARFRPPPAGNVSYSMSQEPKDDALVVAPVQRLETILDSLGHSHVGILKMDIEGAEIAVIEHLVENPVAIDQVLVEFHHGIGDKTGIERTERALDRLRSLGYKLLHRSAVGRECAFLRLNDARQNHKVRLETD